MGSTSSWCRARMAAWSLNVADAAPTGCDEVGGFVVAGLAEPTPAVGTIASP